MSEAMRKIVMGVLSRPEVKKIDFTLGGVKIDKTVLGSVAGKLRSKDIDVDYVAALGTKIAKYKIGENKYVLGTKSGLSADMEALIVHESVHAANDLSSKSLKVSTDEAAAYVAQALYFYYRNEKVLANGAKPTFTDSLLREAWNAATLARSKKTKTLSDKDIQKLVGEISRDPKYRGTAATTRKYDGV